MDCGLYYFFYSNGKKYIDYYLLTHYHSDHIGALFSVKEEKKNYYLTGVTDVYQHFPAHIIVDRGGDFFPPSFSDSCYANYCRFIKSIGNKVEHQTFKVGTDEQISLLYNKVAYPSFYIQNVYANGMLALKMMRLIHCFLIVFIIQKKKCLGKTCIVV